MKKRRHKKKLRKQAQKNTENISKISEKSISEKSYKNNSKTTKNHQKK